MTPDPIRLGHVPEWNLIKYRQLKSMSDQFKRLGNTIGSNDMADANTCYRLAAKYQDKANEFRAIIPEES